MDLEHNKRIYAKLVARAWTDDAFKAELLHDPTKVARDHGMTLPPNATVAVVHKGSAISVDTSGPHPTLHILLPPRPADLTDEAILEFPSDSYMCRAASSSSNYS